MTNGRAPKRSVRVLVSWAALVLVAAVPLVGPNVRAARAAVAEPQFGPYVGYPTSFGPESIAVADFTGDGRKDIVSVSGPNVNPDNAFDLFLFAQRADGSFTQEARLAMSNTGLRPILAAGDVDGDGRADVVAPTGGGMDVFLQRNGTLAQPRFVDAPGVAQVEIADVDGDGRADVVAAGTGGVAWLRGSGDGTFGPPIAISAVQMRIDVGHFNREGRLDVVGIKGSTLYVLRQHADGSFSSSESASVNGEDVAVGDLNGDGLDDVAMTVASNSPSSSVVVWPQRPDGSLGPAIFNPAYDVPKPLKLADVNGDGRTDVVTLHDGWFKAGVLLQDVDGTLTQERLFDVPYGNYHAGVMAVDDVNGDGRPDIVYGDGAALAVLLGAAPIPAATTTSTTAASTTTVPGPTTTTTTTKPSVVDEATSWQIDAAHSGGSSGGAERPPLAKRWTRDLEGDVAYPLIAAGKVFAVARTAHGSEGSTLFAIDAVTGKDAWGPIDLGSRAFAAYGDGQVFVLNADGVLRSLDATTGRQRWITDGYPSSAPPVYRDGVVYLDDRADSSFSQLAAVSAADGHLLWTHPTVAADTAPAVGGDTVFTSLVCGPQAAWRAGTGELLWSTGGACYGGSGNLTPVLADGLLWVRSVSGRLPEALDQATGKEVVTFTADAAPAFYAQHGYFLDRGAVEARQPRTQEVLWRFPGDGQLTAAPIVVNGYVYSASASGRVWALDAATGAVAWSDDAGAPVLKPGENEFRPLFTALAAGQGIVAVPASHLLVAYANGSASSGPAAVGGNTPAAVAAPTAAAAASTPASDDAPAFRIDGSHQGTLLSGVEQAPMRKRWTRDLGSPAQYSLLVGGRMFVAAGRELFALDAVTGADVWGPVTLGPDQAPRSNVSYGDGRVFASFREGPLRAFDAASGQELWSVLPTEYGQEDFGVPTVYDQGIVYALTSHGVVRALSAATGKQLWTAFTDGGMYSPPTVSGGLVVVATCGHGALALDAGTGTRVWRAAGSCTSGNSFQTAASGGEVWAEAPGVTPLVRDAATGRIVGASSGALPSFDKQRTYALEGTAVKGRDRVTKATLWTFPGDGHLVTSPVDVNGRIYVGSASGKVWALDATTGAPVWSDDAGAPIRARDPLAYELGTNIAAGQGLVAVPASNLMVAYETVPGLGGRYHPLSPSRVLDTRTGVGAPVAKVGEGATLGLQVTGRGGVPASGVAAVVLNVTVTEPSATSYLTAWPAGLARPLASNLDYVAGQNVPNLVVVKVGDGGRVDLYNNLGSTHVVADVAGWYAA